MGFPGNLHCMSAFFFTSRIAFLLNLAFLAVLLLRMGAIDLSQPVTASLVAAGWFLSPLFNLLVHAWWLLRWRNLPIDRMNGWLPASNAVIFVIQILYFFF